MASLITLLGIKLNFFVSGITHPMWLVLLCYMSYVCFYCSWIYDILHGFCLADCLIQYCTKALLPWKYAFKKNGVNIFILIIEYFMGWKSFNVLINHTISSYMNSLLQRDNLPSSVTIALKQ